MLILDTNVLSELMRETPGPTVQAWLDQQRRESVWTTAVSAFELHFGIQTLTPGRRRDALQAALQRLLGDKIGHRVAPFDDAAAQASAGLMGERPRAGHPMEFRDSMIAGIALSTGASLAARNLRNFADLSLSLIDPWAV